LHMMREYPISWNFRLQFLAMKVSPVARQDIVVLFELL
jgi:hypothetical protein